jgi:cytidylate kinase
MLVIGIHGPIGSGKSTIAERLSSRWGVRRLSFAGALKRAVAFMIAAEEIMRSLPAVSMDYNDIMNSSNYRHHFEAMHDVEMKKRYRLIMQGYGTDLRRGEDSETWVRIMRDEISQTCRHNGVIAQLTNQANTVVIDDVRFPNEASMVASMGGKLIRVRRGGTVGSAPHESEAHLNDLPFDFTIDNNTTVNALHAAVDEVVGRIQLQLKPALGN